MSCKLHACKISILNRRAFAYDYMSTKTHLFSSTRPKIVNNMLIIFSIGRETYDIRFLNLIINC